VAAVSFSPWPYLSCAAPPEKDIRQAEGHGDKTACEKKPRLGKEHLPVAAFVSEAVIPERREIDLAPYVQTCKRYEPQQGENPCFPVLAPLKRPYHGQEKDETYKGNDEEVEHYGLPIEAYSLQLIAWTGQTSIASWQLQVPHFSGPMTHAFSSLISNTSGQISGHDPHPMQVS
jgi:hypothetical protein